MIKVYYTQRDDLVKKKWSDDIKPRPNLVRAFPCKINSRVTDDNGNLCPMTANIYVDDILAAAARQDNMAKLLEAVIEAIFTVCGTPDIAIWQCPLSLEKWHELITGPRQLVLGLVIDTNTLTVDITEEYIEQVRVLLDD